MSGAQTSTFGDPNILYKALSGMGTEEVQRNQLLNQQTQQAVTDHDIAAVGQAAAPLLGMSEEDAANAYPGWLQDMQSRGLAKYAPPTYPGHSATAALVQRAMPLIDQYKMGLMTSPGTQSILDRVFGTGTTGSGATGTATGSTTATDGGDGLTGDKARDLPLIAQRESGGDPTALNYVAKADPTAYARGATASGKYQIVNSTWRDGMQLAGLDPSQYATARDAPEPVQDKVASALYDKYGAKPWQKGSADWVKDEQGRYQMAAVRPSAGAPGSTPSVTAPGGVAAPTADGRYQVASNAQTAPPASIAPAGGDLMGPRVLPPMGPGSPVVTPRLLANTPAPQPQPQLPQPPANRAMPGSVDGPPAPAQPQPPASAPAPSVATGVNSPQFQLAQQKLRQAAAIAAMPGYQYNPQLQAAAAYLKEQAAAYAQADSVVKDPRTGVQIHTLTGLEADPAKPLADYHETSPGSGIWVGGPGTEPRFQPPGRLVVTPGGDVYQTTSGGPVLLKRTDPQAVAALEEAKASGAATGTAVAKQLPALMEQARNAAAQEGQIDYATNQLREAAKGGVPTGYFSQGLATAAAAAKSLGIDTAKLGINPEAVGNIQTAQKTLSVIGGAILRQALGPGSAVTDSKIEQFIHTQPGIETDPQALQRIMAWARSQYTYERELGHAAVSEAAKPENGGRLPPHWLPAYYRDHGFAPIYDPGTQEMRQPDGTQPTRETPPPARSVPAKIDGDAAFNALPSGAIFVGPDGKMRKKP